MALSWFRRKSIFIPLVLSAVAIALSLALGVGLGLGLRKRSSPPSPFAPPTSTPLRDDGTIWQPVLGMRWQIVLLNPLSDETIDRLDSDWRNTAVFDIDLFTNPPSTFEKLRAAGKKVICYFSAGSYEPGRPDSSNFVKEDIGKELEGWPGEFWLNISSPAVRDIMVKRMDLAVEKGCDAVDPDNVDGYDNENGLGLTRDASVEFMLFLTSAARSRKLSIGLKNSGAVVDDVVGGMQFAVNEQCSQYQECADYRPFVDALKPVFRIEYLEGAPEISVVQEKKSSVCGDKDAQGFSTLIKEMDLGEWVESC